MRIPRKVRRRINIALPIIMFLVGLISLFGWNYDIDAIKYVGGNIPLKPSTCVMLMLAAIISLGIYHVNLINKLIVTVAAGALISLISSVTISSLYPMTKGFFSFIGFTNYENIHIDRSYVPTIGTIVNFIIFALCGIFSLTFKKSKWIGMAGAFIALGGVVGLIGHILNIPLLYSYSKNTVGMSTLACLLYIMLGYNLYLIHKDYTQAEI